MLYFSVLVVVVLIVIQIFQSSPRKTKRPLNGRIYVIDGDTIDHDGLRIRLTGMDAPEMKQSGGPEARQALISLLADAHVSIVPKETDVYGRTVARVFADGADISAEMVARGYAISDTYGNTYPAQEKRARRLRRGLWKNGNISDPAIFRKTS